MPWSRREWLKGGSLLLGNVSSLHERLAGRPQRSDQEPITKSACRQHHGSENERRRVGATALLDHETGNQRRQDPGDVAHGIVDADRKANFLRWSATLQKHELIGRRQPDQ